MRPYKGDDGAPAGTGPWRALLALCLLPGAAALRSQGVEEEIVQNPAVLVMGAGPGAQVAGASLAEVRPDLEPLETAWGALNASVPNLHVSESGSGAYGALFAARGLANTPYFGEPAVTVYFADIPLPSSFAYPEGLFGFDTAEVLLGPRGTEFGRATDGAVVVFSPREAVRAGGEAEAGAGSYGSRLAALSGSTDPRAGADAAAWAEYDARDGYVRNNQLGLGVGGQENTEAFARLRLRPWAGAELALELLDTRGRDGAQPLVPLGGPLYSVTRAQEGVTDLDSFGAALKGTFALTGHAVLSSVTSFTDWRMDPYSSFLVIPPPLTNRVDQAQRRWNEELRLRGVRRGPLRAEAGAWLSRGTTSNDVLRAIPHLYPVEGSSFSEAEGTAAAFGQVAAELGGGYTLTAGLRAEAGDKVFDRLEQVPVSGLAYHGADRYGALLPRLSAQWRPAPGSTLEVSAAEGIRAGGFSSFTDNPALIPFAPERSTQYSAGWTGANSGGSASLSLRAFYTSIDNLQIERSFSATDYFVATAPRAHSLGAEAEGIWKPSGTWTLRAFGGWTRSLLDQFDAPLIGRDESGHEAPGVPAYNAGVTVTLRPAGPWFAEAQAVAFGRTYFDEEGTPRYAQGAYATAGLRAGLSFGRWSLLVFGDNLAGAGYYELIIPGVNSGMPGAPRTFGTRVTLRY